MSAAQPDFVMLREIVATVGSRRVVAVDTIAHLKPEDAGQVVMTGSHGGISSGEYAGKVPIAAVFFLGVFMRRLNAKGCLSALVVGFALGVFRLLVDTPVSLGMMEGGYAEGSFLWIINNIYFQYYSLVIFLVSCAVLIGVSYATEPPSDAQLEGITYGTVTAEQRAETRASWNQWDVIGTAVVLGLILAAYIYFNG